MYDIVTIGAGTRDVFLVTDKFQMIQSSKFATGVGECVSLGSKIEVDNIIHSTGGGATNAASTFSRLGYSCATICKVGTDHAGRDLIIDLQRDGINTTLIKRAKGVTGYSTLLTDKKSGERSVLVHRGVSAKFNDSDVNFKECKARWYYVTSLAGNMNVVKKLTTAAKKCRGQIAWNPGSKELAKGLKSVKALSKQCRVLNMNREEAEKLTKKTKLDAMFASLASKETIVIITDGANGAYAHEGGKTYFANTTGAKAVSTTGAGDAFGSGFVAGLMKTNNIKKALAVGVLNAEGVIGSFGAKNGILKKWPTAAQLKKVKIKTV